MEREVFTQARFQTYAERFVLLRVDVEDGAAGSELQRRFQRRVAPDPAAARPEAEPAREDRGLPRDRPADRPAGQ
jgi:hypothetical protein